jgi:hypothetical protein
VIEVKHSAKLRQFVEPEQTVRPTVCIHTRQIGRDRDRNVQYRAVSGDERIDNCNAVAFLTRTERAAHRNVGPGFPELKRPETGSENQRSRRAGINHQMTGAPEAADRHMIKLAGAHQLRAAVSLRC